MRTEAVFGKKQTWRSGSQKKQQDYPAAELIERIQR